MRGPSLPTIEGDMKTSFRRASFARPVLFTLGVMLLTLFAVAAVGLVTSRATTGALEEFRAETVDESARNPSGSETHRPRRRRG